MGASTCIEKRGIVLSYDYLFKQEICIVEE